MTTIAAERGKPTVLRAAHLFNGDTASLIADPMLVLDGGRIVSVDHGTAPPAGANVVDLPGATLHRDYLSRGLRGTPALPTILAAGPPITTHAHGVPRSRTRWPPESTAWSTSASGRPTAWTRHRNSSA